MENHFELVSYAPSGTKKPVRGTKESAGYDFYAPIDIFIPAKGVSENIPLYVKAYLENNTFLQLKIRSGLAVKHNIILCTSGVIDSDYVDNADNEGNICVKFANLSDEDFTIKAGERCCQGIILNYGKVVDDEFLQDKRVGGHGSTGQSEFSNTGDEQFTKQITKYINAGVKAEYILGVIIKTYNDEVKNRRDAEFIFPPKAPHVDTPKVFIVKVSNRLKKICLGYKSTEYYMEIASGVDDKLLLNTFIHNIRSLPLAWRTFMRTH